MKGDPHARGAPPLRGMKICSRWITRTSGPAVNAHASADSWPKVLAFLEAALR